ncbi:heparinase II/III domain-containing protein [Halomonas caseinilytica]|uniref:heparinase II/III domain-containing protein n=1 Tax=Halomonas caseinilytica TaxID=438744 RepID=UPI00147D82C3|nr:heparinase II/III family protein [Halomonas caseinilytica]
MTGLLWTQEDMALIRGHVDQPGRLGQSLGELTDQVDEALTAGVVVPGQGDPGSYEHNTHKHNAKLIEHAALLGRVKDNPAYLDLARDLLLKYARQYRSMPYQVAKNTNPPGKLFHQILNEHIWLVGASLGYSLLGEHLHQDERERIESGLFQPMLDMFTVTYAHDFDRIHNHGLWAVAAVGLCGLAIGQTKPVDQAIFGQDGSGETGGFLAQIDRLFSPDGYYVEGPYYHRFAVHPLCLFAEALALHRPELGIHERSEQRIGRSIRALLATAYPDGTFPALNDASRTMDIDDEGVRVALAVHIGRYGAVPELVDMAVQQGGTWVHRCGAVLAEAVQAAPATCPVPSALLADGSGGQAHLKQGEGARRHHLVVSAGQHGMGHGHFDLLGLSFFSGGRERLTEYGFCRWVNVEPKFGGRYLAENEGYAKQSVAHNLVVVDQSSQHRGDHYLADECHGRIEQFVDRSDIDGLTAVCGSTDDAYPGVALRRHGILLTLDPSAPPLLIDIVEARSGDNHCYDYVFNPAGQIIRWWGGYTPRETLDVLGDGHGYQHLWVVGEQQSTGGGACEHAMTWLDGDRFTTWHQYSEHPATAMQLLVGANDPEHNLRHEKKVMSRVHADSTLFVNVFEQHGFFDEASERCQQARPDIRHIEVKRLSEERIEVTLIFAWGEERLIVDPRAASGDGYITFKGGDK